jgi:hypothetical protein
VYQTAPEFKGFLIKVMDVAGCDLPVCEGLFIGDAVILPELKSGIDVSQL